MKKKEFSKKLEFKKETISKLQQKMIIGGGDPTKTKPIIKDDGHTNNLTLCYTGCEATKGCNTWFCL